MNTTVWYEQIDRGLVDFIQKVVKLKNREGDKIPVPVRIRKPDEDFKKEDYPMITITNLFTSKRDEIRYFPFKVLRGIDKTTGKGKLERTAVPYSVYYQIDFWSIFQSDINEMLALWEFEVSRDFVLPVIDSGGTARDTFALQMGDSLFREDKLKGNERVFCSSITYRIWAEIDESNEDNIEDCDLVTDVELHMKSK